jgi:hypothetical protein
MHIIKIATEREKYSRFLWKFKLQKSEKIVMGQFFQLYF